MALLRYKDIVKMDKKELESKLKDLKIELVKANIISQKQNAKTKEIKKAISRIITFINSKKGIGEKQK